MHAPRQVGFHESEAVTQGEGQLADGVGPGLGNVVAADGHTVEVAHVVVHKVLGNVAHHFQAELGAEDAGVLALIFFQDVGLYGAAHVGQHPLLDLGGFCFGGLAAVVGLELVQVLVDGRVHEHGQNAGRGAVDGHADAGGGAAQVKPAVQHLHVVQRGHVHAAVADLAVNVGAQVGVVAVQRDRVERGGQALGGHALAHQLEAAVGAEGVTFAREHAGGVFALALEGEGACGVGVTAGHVVQHQPLQNFAVVFVLRQAHLADGGAAQTFGGERSADFLVADLHHVFVAGVGLLHRRPLGHQLTGGGVHAVFAFLRQLQGGLGGPGLAGLAHFQHGGSRAKLLHFAGQARLGAGLGLVAAHGVGNFGQVAGAYRGHDGGLVGAVAHRHHRQAALGHRQAQFGQPGFERLVQRSHAVVVEAGGHGAKHRHLVGGGGPGLLVALHLLGHIAQRIRGTLAVKLVDGDKLGKVQHVDLFQLAGRAKLGRHHVHGHINVRHDGRIALADAGGFHDHQVEPRHFAGGNYLGQRGGNFAAEIAGGQAAHENALPVCRADTAGPPQGVSSPLGGQRRRVSGKRGGSPYTGCVHADAVAQQGTTALAAAGVDADDGHAQLVVLVQPQAADQFVRQAGLACAAGAGDAQYRYFIGSCQFFQIKRKRVICC